MRQKLLELLEIAAFAKEDPLLPLLTLLSTHRSIKELNNSRPSFLLARSFGSCSSERQLVFS